MTVTTTATYTCDRDGTVSEPSTSGLPAGWSTLSCSGTVAAPPPVEGQPKMPPMMNMISLILCPACTTAFNTFRTTY